MAQHLKGDCINKAYELLRISGLTSIPTPSEITTALEELESMAHEYLVDGICFGYNFEDSPGINSSSNIPPEYRIPFALCLATRLTVYFGKGASDKIDPILFQRQSGAVSFLRGSTIELARIRPSNRCPVGSGNERNGYNKYFVTPKQAPVSCKTNKMVIGEIDNFIEHFDSFLIDSEVILSYTIEASTGLTIVSDSLLTPDISYQISATGTTEGLEQVKIVATADSGRVEIRLINFDLEIIDIA